MKEGVHKSLVPHRAHPHSPSDRRQREDWVGNFFFFFFFFCFFFLLQRRPQDRVESSPLIPIAGQQILSRGKPGSTLQEGLHERWIEPEPLELPKPVLAFRPAKF